MPGTYPGGGVLVTVDGLLKRPTTIARALTDLVYKRFVTDRVFTPGSPDQVAGGAATFQRSESIFMDRDPEEIGVRAGWPRAGWTEELFMALVKTYGLEFPINDRAKRRNALDQVMRAQRKIANSLVKFVDTLTMALLTSAAEGIQVMAASGDWSTAATDIIADLANSRALIANVEEGYEADTLIINPAQELDLIIDKDLRDAMPREGNAPQPAVLTGKAVPILGLRQILVTSAITAGTAVVTESGMVGTIADELPLSEENYVTYNAGPGAPRIWVKVYRDEPHDDTIIRGARFPAMWISEPKSVVKITGA